MSGNNICFIYSKMVYIDNNLVFLTKSSLRSHPFVSLSIGVVMIITIFGISIKFMEYYNAALIAIINE